MYTMQRVRRIVTVLTSLAMLQLSMLGSSLACPRMDGDTKLAGHGDHAPAHVHDSAQADHDAPAHPEHRGDCLARACTSPLALPGLEVAFDPVESPAHLALGAARAPDSLIQVLDPPPPRG